MSETAVTPTDFTELDAMWREHRPRLLAAAGSRLDPRLGSRVDADDIVQEAYFRSRSKWPKYDPSQWRAYFWLYVIVKDCLIEEYRKAYRGPNNLALQLPFPEPSADWLALRLSQTGPGTAAERAERQARVRAALEQLEVEDRQILALHYFDGLKLAEAAESVGIEPAAARQRHLRALQKLKPFLPDGSPS